MKFNKIIALLIISAMLIEIGFGKNTKRLLRKDIYLEDENISKEDKKKIKAEWEKKQKEVIAASEDFWNKAKEEVKSLKWEKDAQYFPYVCPMIFYAENKDYREETKERFFNTKEMMTNGDFVYLLPETIDRTYAQKQREIRCGITKKCTITIEELQKEAKEEIKKINNLAKLKIFLDKCQYYGNAARRFSYKLGENIGDGKTYAHKYGRNRSSKDNACLFASETYKDYDQPPIDKPPKDEPPKEEKPKEKKPTFHCELIENSGNDCCEDLKKCEERTAKVKNEIGEKQKLIDERKRLLLEIEEIEAKIKITSQKKIEITKQIDTINIKIETIKKEREGLKIRLEELKKTYEIKKKEGCSEKEIIKYEEEISQLEIELYETEVLILKLINDENKKK